MSQNQLNLVRISVSAWLSIQIACQSGYSQTLVPRPGEWAQLPVIPTAPQIWDLDSGCDLARKADITRLTLSSQGTVGSAPHGPWGVRTLPVSLKVSDEPAPSHRHFSLSWKNVVSGVICVQPTNTFSLSPFPGWEGHVGKGTQSRSWGPWTYRSCGGPRFCTPEGSSPQRS